MTLSANRARLRTAIPTALTIAGSDPSGGAGIQADLKTISALGVYAMAAITALTAQNTLGVTGIQVVPAGFVAHQVRTVLADITPDAIKIGMIGSAKTADRLAALLAEHPEIPVVLDPVLIATSGDALADDDTPDAIRALLPRVDLLTPNLSEAATLLGTRPATTVDEMKAQATALLDAGARRVLLKGGHLDGEATDVYVGRAAAGAHLSADGLTTRLFTAARVDTNNTHGTGCTLSSAITAFVARGYDFPDAVGAAKSWLTEALKHSQTIGHGHGPVNHFFALSH